ncbi:tryptophan 2,3- dioxygenase [Coemansia sp. RSA 2336]|nr:tryptophan 2,3- dioxygenase [Coemansia sp. RSA 2336]
MPDYSQAKQLSASYTPLRLEDYDISPTHGFLPSEPPLKRLSDPYYAPWEEIMDRFNQYLLAHHIRRLVRKMPVLGTDRLATQAEYRRAFSILSFMAHAYVWGRNGAVSEPALEFLPASIAVPWVATAEFLQLNPVVCCAGVCHWNWQILDPDADDVMDIDNLGTIHTFSGSLDESWFYLVTTAIEAKCARGLNAILAAVEAVEEDDMEKVTHSLHQIAYSLGEANGILERMYERCDPYVFYWKIREFLAGWENMEEAGLPYGVLYEGVDDTDTFSLDNWQSLLRRFRKYAGGSAAQTPLLQAFDIALGIKHFPTGEKQTRPAVVEARNRLSREQGVAQPPAVNSYLVRMRNYMPGGHRRFLEDLAATCRIREYVLLACSDSLLHMETADDPRVRLRQAYNVCVDLMKMFRDKHLMIVTRYIISPAKHGPMVPQRVAVPETSKIMPPSAYIQAMNKHMSKSQQGAGGGGRLGGDSLPADPTMYPQTNLAASKQAESPKCPAHSHFASNGRSKSMSPQAVAQAQDKGRLARTLDDHAVARGTGGTDAIQFLKQVRNETAQSKI